MSNETIFQAGDRVVYRRSGRGAAQPERNGIFVRYKPSGRGQWAEVQDADDEDQKVYSTRPSLVRAA